MTYTTRELISRAYYLSGVVARDLQTVSGGQINDGLKLLNALLAIKTANNRLIPYYQLLTVPGVPNQERYFIENLISVESLTFNIGVVRYSMLRMDRVTYFGSPRVDNISALPYSYYVERCLNGANIYIYFLETGSYPLNIYGKFSLASVTLDQNLELTIDDFYIEYLRYALADYIAADYNITLQPQTEKKLAEYEQIITDISPVDLVIEKLSTLDVRTSINYGDVNLGKGWRPV